MFQITCNKKKQKKHPECEDYSVLNYVNLLHFQNMCNFTLYACCKEMLLFKIFYCYENHFFS